MTAEDDAGRRSGASVTMDERRRMIAERAMRKTLDRGFGQRSLARDWRDAEQEVDDELEERQRR